MGDGRSQPAVDTSVVGVRVPADLTQLTMLRALAETVALIGDFALDEVTDIRVALDEVATALILAATSGSNITCDFEFDGGHMRVRVGATAIETGSLEQDGFGWRVLQTLTESITVQTGPYAPLLGGYPTLVEFSLSRGDRQDG